MAAPLTDKGLRGLHDTHPDLSLLVATLPFGSVLAQEPKATNAKVTLISDAAGETLTVFVVDTNETQPTTLLGD